MLRLGRYASSHGTYVPQIRMHSAMAGGFYLLTMLMGTIIYPAFRVEVRAELFDTTMPWLTGLFEIKEHLAALGIVPAIMLLVIGRLLDFHHVNDRRYLPIVSGLAAFVLAIVLFNTGAGWYLSTVKSL